ncbi:histidine kinase [Salix suchowensis]|nr:histidine kinase [Salix suchowensis]
MGTGNDAWVEENGMESRASGLCAVVCISAKDDIMQVPIASQGPRRMPGLPLVVFRHCECLSESMPSWLFEHGHSSSASTQTAAMTPSTLPVVDFVDDKHIHHPATPPNNSKIQLPPPVLQKPPRFRWWQPGGRRNCCRSTMVGYLRTRCLAPKDTTGDIAEPIVTKRRPTSLLGITFRWMMERYRDFFSSRFDDAEMERRFSEENWDSQRRPAFWSAIFMIINWVLGCAFIVQPMVLADKIFYFLGFVQSALKMVYAVRTITLHSFDMDDNDGFPLKHAITYQIFCVHLYGPGAHKLLALSTLSDTNLTSAGVSIKSFSRAHLSSCMAIRSISHQRIDSFAVTMVSLRIVLMWHEDFLTIF